ncbi:MAG TPA: hypothetical protein VMV29_07225 [Ktedonobacterales bacterium]|nr:hypothetical protein [Ktedonobacterales bacterium]
MTALTLRQGSRNRLPAAERPQSLTPETTHATIRACRRARLCGPQRQPRLSLVPQQHSQRGHTV